MILLLPSNFLIDSTIVGSIWIFQYCSDSARYPMFSSFSSSFISHCTALYNGCSFCGGCRCCTRFSSLMGESDEFIEETGESKVGAVGMSGGVEEDVVETFNNFDIVFVVLQSAVFRVWLFSLPLHPTSTAFSSFL